MSQPTNWTAALAILAVGIVAGIILIAAMRRRKGSAPAGSRRAALEKKKDVLVRKIRSSEDPEERRRLQLEAADVLREIDRCDEVPHPAVEVPPDTRRPMFVGFALGVISTIVVGLLGYYGWRSATPRDTGSSVAMASSAPAAPPDLAKWEKAVETDPENVDNRVALAKAYLSSQNLMGVYDQTAAVLKKNPDEPRALTYNAIVRMSMGQLDDARGMLEKAVGRDPRLLDGWVALASVRTQMQQHDGAAAAVESAIAQYPAEEPRLRQLLAEMRSKPAEAAAPASEAPQSLPPDHPPLRTASTGKDSLIRVTLALDPSLGAKGGIVYV
ncbi:MAG TPA: tetratricopeptide repeat protein, partial [Thermoanaerobaculia bacterium]|nr:tetratricopeptide repeat protein [Thermoanaerobaculia bacterium]